MARRGLQWHPWMVSGRRWARTSVGNQDERCLSVDLLFEREAQLEQLEELLAKCSYGTGSVVVVSGATGTGKTALLNAISERVTATDGLVLSASGLVGDAGSPLGVVMDLLSNLEMTPAVAKLCGMAAMARRAPTLPAQHPLRPFDPQLPRGLWQVLRDLAAQHLVLLALDDVHNADAESMQCILYVLRKIRPVPVVAILTESGGAYWADPVLQAELLREPYCRRIRLDPLSHEGVASLVHARGSEQANEIFRLSGGNPLLARALVADEKEACERGRVQGAAAGGDAFRRVLLSCIHRYEPAMLAVTRGLALLEKQATCAVLARLLDLDPTTVSRALGDLEEAGLVSGNEFRHPATATIVLENMSDGSRRHWYSRVALLRQDEGAGPIEVAKHLVAGQVADQAAWPTLLEAAEQADQQKDVAFAVQCLELASTAAATDEQRATTRMALVRVQRRMNPAVAARHLGSLVQSLFSRQLPDDATVSLVRELVWLGDLTTASALLEFFRDPVRVSGLDARTAARLQILRQWLRYVCPPLHEQLPAAPVPAAFTKLVEAATVLAESLVHGPDQNRDDSYAVSKQVLCGCQLDDESLDIIEMALLTLVRLGQMDEVSAWCDRLVGQALERQAYAWYAQLISIRAEAALRSRDFATAERLVQGAFERLPTRGWGVAVGAPLATLILALIEMGRIEDATQEVLVAGPPRSMRQTRYGVLYEYARSCCHLAAGRLHDALVGFLACGEHLSNWSLQVPGFVPWQTGAAAVYLRMGADDAAGELVAEQLAQSRIEWSAHDEGLGHPLLAYADAAYNGDGRHCGVEAVHDFLEWMAQQASSCFVPSVLTPHILTRPDDKTSPDASLSSAEQRVAELAARGHSNREVAKALYITVSTVEQHLTRVYRKFNLSGRSELATILHSASPGQTRDEEAEAASLSHGE